MAIAINPARIYAITMGVLAAFVFTLMLANSAPMDFNGSWRRATEQMNAALGGPAVTDGHPADNAGVGTAPPPSELTAAVAPRPDDQHAVDGPDHGAVAVVTTPPAPLPSTPVAASATSRPQRRQPTQPVIAMTPTAPTIDHAALQEDLLRLARRAGISVDGEVIEGPSEIPEENLRQQRAHAAAKSKPAEVEPVPSPQDMRVAHETQYVSGRCGLMETPLEAAPVSHGERELVVMPGLRVQTFGRYRGWTFVRDNGGTWEGWIETSKLASAPLRPPGRILSR
jgi:hypothetical protein